VPCLVAQHRVASFRSSQALCSPRECWPPSVLKASIRGVRRDAHHREDMLPVLKRGSELASIRRINAEQMATPGSPAFRAYRHKLAQVTRPWMVAMDGSH
jgi:hypothetical protein